MNKYKELMNQIYVTEEMKKEMLTAIFLYKRLNVTLSVLLPAHGSLPTEIDTTQSIRAAIYMEKYGDTILRIAYSYVLNIEDAKDILQDTLINVVIKKSPTFENEHQEKAYILKTASNLAKNKIRYNKRHETVELNTELPYEESDDYFFVREAIEKLPDNAKIVICLFHMDGLKISEIAKLLGRKESTISSDLHRARKLLKEILKEEYDYE